MATFQPADNLRSRTFLGLLVAQFLAAFNDQAIHASAMFFAINKQALSETRAITLMPILFYAPWAIFCTLAGYLADRYSKRTALVLWKVIEVGIAAVALAGFWLGTQGYAAGPWIVLSTVFLMGTHSAFFVPAKYGAMPEILQPEMLSRGNGILESLSFLAVILGTVVGGILSTAFHGSEYWIGVVLVALAVVGAVASLMIRRMPAANPDRPFPRDLYRPLFQNIRALFSSRPLAFAVIGIAFFTFIVAFMRATVYLHGEVQSPPWTESKTSEIVGMVALGIGLGSPFVGFLSGSKVELGLVPIGALGMVAATLVAAGFLGYVPALIVCITLIGFFTGFYIVPLFTLLQQRAPKASKGDAVATSNFINVTGAIAASLVVFTADLGARVTGVTPLVVQVDRAAGELAEDPVYAAGRPVQVVLAGRSPVQSRQGKQYYHQINLADDGSLIDPFKDRLKRGDRVVESVYKIGDVRHHTFRREGQPQKAVYDQRLLPRFLFVGAALMTMFTLLLLGRQMPDLYLRSALWVRLRGRYRLNVHGANNLPGTGPVLVASNAAGLEAGFQVLASTDRTARFVFLQSAKERTPGRLTRRFMATSSLLWLPEETDSGEADAALAKIADVLRRGEILGLPLPDPASDGVRAAIVEQAYAAATRDVSAPVIPVWYERGEPERRSGVRRVDVMFGRALPAGVGLAEVRAAICRLGDDFREQNLNGTCPKVSLTAAH
jgi:Major Facilitator Superfamily